MCGGKGFTGFAGPKGRIRVLLQFKPLTTVLTLLFYCQVVNKIQMSHHGFTKKTYAFLPNLPRPAVSILSGRTYSFTILCQYHGFMKLAQKIVIFWSVSSEIRLPAQNVFALFVKKNVMYHWVFTNLQKNFF